MGKIINRLKWMKRWYYRKKYRLNHVHPRFLATKGLQRVSSDVKAGAYSYIGPFCEIYPNVQIGNYSLIARDVLIIGGDHNFRTPGIPSVFNGREEFKKTIIGDDVWIGARSMIMTGVSIGNGAIVAAGSVVTKDIEPYSIYGGVPATKIKMRFAAEEIKIHEEMLKLPVEDLEKRNFKLVGTKDVRPQNKV